MKAPRGRMERQLHDVQFGGIPWAGAVRITKPDGTVEHERALTYRERRNLGKTGSAKRRPRIPAKVRAQVLARDLYTCMYCGDVAGPFVMDHIRPYSKGGWDHPANLATACIPCNIKKSNRWSGATLKTVRENWDSSAQ